MIMEMDCQQFLLWYQLLEYRNQLVVLLGWFYFSFSLASFSFMLTWADLNHFWLIWRHGATVYGCKWSEHSLQNSALDSETAVVCSELHSWKGALTTGPDHFSLSSWLVPLALLPFSPPSKCFVWPRCLLICWECVTNCGHWCCRQKHHHSLLVSPPPPPPPCLLHFLPEITISINCLLLFLFWWDCCCRCPTMLFVQRGLWLVQSKFRMDAVEKSIYFFSRFMKTYTKEAQYDSSLHCSKKSQYDIWQFPTLH